MKQGQAISPPNKEEEQREIDLEMEDAQTEEERDTIRAERALAKQQNSPFTKQLNEELGNMMLSDLACKPCHDDQQENQQ